MAKKIFVAILLSVAVVLGVFAVFAFMLAPLTPSVAQAVGPASSGSLQTITVADTNTGVMVSGEGKVSIKPNIAIATIGVDITTANLTDATSQANTKMNAVIEKLKSLGVADKDIQTVNYNLYPITAPSKGPDSSAPPAITGYRVSNQVRVTVRKLDDLGKLLDAAVTAGANNIYGVSFSVDDVTPYQQQARAAAIKDASDKAALIAKSAGIQLGPILSITESGAMPIPLSAPSARFSAGGATDVPIQTGEMQVTIDVAVRYSIK